jgi:hypothetical protein
MSNGKFSKTIKTCPIIGSAVCRCIAVNTSPVSNVKPDVKSLLRKLFTDRAVYTKFYIESVLQDSPDSSSIGKRLYENQEEIGLNVGYIVGTDKGIKLSALLKQHIQAASATVIAAKNHQKLDAHKSKLFANSKHVAAFLSGLNRTMLPYPVIKKHFDQHNQFVLEMVNLHLTKKYDAEILKYDQYYNHMMMVSDLLYVALTTILLNSESSEIIVKTDADISSNWPETQTTSDILRSNDNYSNDVLDMSWFVFISLLMCYGLYLYHY